MKLEEWQFIVVILGTIIATILSVLTACIGFFKFFGKAIIQPWVITICNSVFEEKKRELERDSIQKKQELLKELKSLFEKKETVQRYKGEFREKLDEHSSQFLGVQLRIAEIDNEFTKIRLIFDRILGELFAYKDRLNDVVNYLKTPENIRTQRPIFQDEDKAEKKRAYKKEMLETSILNLPTPQINPYLEGYSGDLSQGRTGRNPKDFDSIPPRE